VRFVPLGDLITSDSSAFAILGSSGADSADLFCPLSRSPPTPCILRNPAAKPSGSGGR